jgi:endoglycosylceramidase
LQPDPGFPAVYFTSPAQNQAWTNLWHDHAAPDGVGLQEHYAAMWAHVAEHFADQRYVLGYDLINEPWPGWGYATCLRNGCPRFETGALASFQARSMAAIRRADPHHLLFFEPPTLNDFGIPNWMPNPTGDPEAGMSFHDYYLGQVDTCITNGLNRSVADGVAALVTEFGAITDAAKLTTLTDRFDDTMASWMFWAQPQNQTPTHRQQPPTGPNLMNPAIVRPYPRAVAGTPQQWNYDGTTGTFTLEYTARHVDSGQPFASGARTEVFLPPSSYPGGYRVESQGAVVVSSPDAPVLELATLPGQDGVRVTVTRR